MKITRFLIGFARSLVFMFRRPIYVTLMGGPGAGKGTVAQTLAPELGLAHLSTGALMRREVEQKTPLGQSIEKIMKAGKLVPDEIVFKLLEQELERPANWRGAILDGFPRTRAQAEWLTSLFGKWHTRLTVAVQLEVPEPDIIERLSGRRVCSNTSCGTTYHVTFNPPKTEGVCDKCQSALMQRADDKPEVVLARLVEYRAAQAPILAYYGEVGGLWSIHTTNKNTPAQVLTNVKSAVLASSNR